MQEDYLELPVVLEGEEVVFDYASLGLTLRTHPLALLRPQLDKPQLLTPPSCRRHRIAVP